MKQMVIKVLGKGDTLVDYRPDRLITRSKQGTYSIYEIVHDSDGIPRINKDTVVKVTHGKGIIEFYDTETRIRVRP